MAVTAKDKASGKEQQIRIEANGGLSEADIEKMVEDAERNSGADKTRRAFVEMKNHADATIDRLEKVLVEHAGILNAQDKAAALAAIASTREAMSGSGEDKLKQAVAHLAQASNRIEEAAAAAQKAQGAPNAGDGNRAPPSGREEAVDADFEEVTGRS